MSPFSRPVLHESKYVHYAQSDYRNYTTSVINTNSSQSLVWIRTSFWSCCRPSAEMKISPTCVLVENVTCARFTAANPPPTTSGPQKAFLKGAFSHEHIFFVPVHWSPLCPSKQTQPVAADWFVGNHGWSFLLEPFLSAHTICTIYIFEIYISYKVHRAWVRIHEWISTPTQMYCAAVGHRCLVKPISPLSPLIEVNSVQTPRPLN